MQQQNTVGYSHELVTLIELIKSNTPESNKVIGVLRSGDEEDIRRMLKNFGNPADYEWKDITSASPWAEWQIDQAISDLLVMKPEDTLDAGFWFW